MSLKFVTRKLKTQTLGDDDVGEQGSDNGASSSTQTESFSNTLNQDKNTVIIAD